MISKKYNEQMGNYLAKLAQAQTNICVAEKPITNADRIRAMTDEELAEFMNNGCDIIAPSENCTSAFYDCKRCWLDWLKEEVE